MKTTKARMYPNGFLQEQSAGACLRRVAVSILLVFLVLFAKAQVTDTGFALVRTYRGDVAGAAVDNLDNLYILSSTGQVKKFGARGDSVAVFNGVRNFGKLTAIDVSNPLTPLLFYKEFSNVVVLDRFLATRASLNLRQYNILQPTAIGLSYDNNIWVYDQFDFKLKKVDEAGNLLLQTADFRQLFGFAFAPQKIVNDDRRVYLADSTYGVLVFDNFGTFQRKLPLTAWRAIDFWRGLVIRLNEDAIVVYNPGNFSERRVPVPTSFRPYVHSFTTTNRFITFSTDSLRIYKIGD